MMQVTHNHCHNVTVAHSGKQHAYRHAHSLQQLGCLHRFITSSYYHPGSWPDRIGTYFPRLDGYLRKRWLCGLEASKVIRRWSLELPELWHRNIMGNHQSAEAAMFLRDARFDRCVSRRYAAESEIFWGFQGSCLESLKSAKNAGRVAVCEFATAHITAAIRILSEEAEKHPEWAGTISNFQFPDWYQNRLAEEPHAADWCIAASTFTRDSLLEVGVPNKRILILPLATDVGQFHFTKRPGKGPLKVLFVGGIGQRKGIKYLLEAIKQLNSQQIQLQLLGPLPADSRPLEQYKPWFEYLGKTDQNGVAKVMQQADLLVLPSVFEGFGLVIVEAMATGLPVIASTHSCGSEVIREGVDGYVLEPDDIEGIANRISILATERDRLAEMGRSAHQQAQNFSWNKHAERLGELLGLMQTRVTSD